MINLEGLAHQLAEALCRGGDLDETEKAKIEYGFSLTLGIGLTFILTMVPAAFLGTFSYTFVLMTFALGTRLFSGGAHCTSYARCLFLSLLIFIPGGALAKLLATNISFVLAALICSGLILAAAICHFCKKRRFALPTALLSTVAVALGLWLRGRFLPEILLPAAMGIFIQTFMTISLGQKVVEKADFWLKRVIK